MKLALALLLTGLASPVLPSRGHECGQCRMGPRGPALCRLHEAAEKRGLREARQWFRIDDQRDRLTALENAAALTRDHENAPSVEVARFLVQGLEDDDPHLRVVAIGLLVDGQDRETASKALIAAARDLDRYVRRVLAAPEPRKNDSAADLEKKARYASDRLYAGVLPGTLAAALVRLATPETREALLRWSGPWDVPVAGSVLSIGTPEALRATLKGMADLERQVEDLRELVGDLDSSSPPRPPAGWEGDENAWRVDRSRTLAARERDLDSLRHLFESLASAKGLEPPPASAGALLERWSAWLESVASRWPEE